MENRKNTNKITTARAALNVLKGWGVTTIYGIPSGTLSSLMDALAEYKDIEYIQVRHEETGSLAAVMQKKFGGPLGVAIGSGGPGATHLINGVYDAAMDNIPFLAILGSREQKDLNMDSFQELNQNPMYDSVAVYNKRVAYAEQLPKIFDEAARTAITRRGPAVVEIPVDFGWVEIPEDAYYSSGPWHREYPNPTLNEADVNKSVELLNQAERPLIYLGVGGNDAGQEAILLSQKIKAPILVTGKNFDAIDYHYEGLLGSAYRVAWKTANDALFEADTVLFVGSNFPFAESMNAFKNTKHFIQVDIDPHKLGKRSEPSAVILGDAKDALIAINQKIKPVSDSAWWRANLKNAENWRDYMNNLEKKESGDLQLYQVYDAINQNAEKDAIFSIDVGNTTQTSIRHLHMNPQNMWRTSPLFASMGIALPGGIAAKRFYPERQVWNLMGDGAFNMCYPDVRTNVQYNYPVINVVFSNTQYGFIKDKYEDTNKNVFGTDFTDVDYAKIAEGQGALGFTVTRIEDIREVMKQAVEANKNGRTVVIDAKITKERPIPVEKLELDPKEHSAAEIEAFKKRYEAYNLKPFREFLEAEGLKSIEH